MLTRHLNTATVIIAVGLYTTGIIGLVMETGLRNNYDYNLYIGV